MGLTSHARGSAKDMELDQRVFGGMLSTRNATEYEYVI